MNHTPGPWKVAPKSCRYGVTDPALRAKLVKLNLRPEFNALGIGADDETKTVAIVPLDDGNIWDAALIAAAASLLVACERVKMYLEAAERGGAFHAPELQILEIAIKLARGME